MSLKILTVGIDPGHTEGYNKGTCPGYFEGTQMHKLSMYELAEFDKYDGVSAKISRSLKAFPSVYDRVKMFQGYDLILSDHTNAPRTDFDKVLIYEPLTVNDQDLSHKLGKTIAATMGIKEYDLLTRKNSSDTDYYGIHRYGLKLGVKLPLIIEHGYHTNAKHCSWLMVDDNLRILARNKVRCIAEHYGLKLKAGQASPVIYYKDGDSGDGVLKMQRDLVRLGYKLDTDGSFGPETDGIIRQYQTDNKLTVDGSAGPQTLSKIAEQIKELDAAIKDDNIFAPEGKFFKVITQFGVFDNKNGAMETAKIVESLLTENEIKVNGQTPWTKIIIE